MKSRILLTFLSPLVAASFQAAPSQRNLELKIFVATDCPIAGRTARTFALHRSSIEKSSPSIKVEFVFPNSYESRINVEKWMKDHGVGDIQFSLSAEDAQARQIRTTPTVLLIRDKSVIYSGKLSERDNPEKPGIIYPLAAATGVAKGKSYSRTTSVTGCPIRINKPIAGTNIDSNFDEDLKSPISWNGDVRSVFQKSCVPCHTGTGVGPVKLTSYSDVYGMATKVQAMVQSRTMPPWQAEDIDKFHDDPSLTRRDLQLLDLWFKRKMPVGGKTPEPLTIPDLKQSQWLLGEPSLTMSLEKPYLTPSDGKDHYRCFVFKNITDRDRWMNAIAFTPGATESVHHVSAFIDTSGAARKMDEADAGPGYTNPTPGNGPGFKDYYVIGGWTPGHKPRALPNGAGIPIPKGADLVVEVHYHLTGKQESDITKAGIYFTDQPIDKRYRVGDVGTYKINIKANDPNGQADASAVINSNVSIHSITPHLHLLGRTMKVTAELPNGQLITVINIRRWDFRWQPSYRFLKPLQLPRGTRIDVIATYDNTASNVDNPHSPPRDIVWGEGTDEEMCSVFFGYTDDDEHLASPIR